MSFLHPEEKRRCQRCSFEWYAEKYGRSDVTQPIFGMGFSKRAQDLSRQGSKERKQQLADRYRYCGECGSKKVKTVKS